jgi:hypothetical protein
MARAALAIVVFMRTMQKIISAGFATCAFAAASMPALSVTTLGVVEGDAVAAADDAQDAPAVILLALLDTDRR